MARLLKMDDIPHEVIAAALTFRNFWVTTGQTKEELFDRCIELSDNKMLNEAAEELQNYLKDGSPVSDWCYEAKEELEKKCKQLLSLL